MPRLPFRLPFAPPSKAIIGVRSREMTNPQALGTAAWEFITS
jgi:hypothetical protein